MHLLFVRLVVMLLCASIAGWSPARADDTGARMMMGLFGAMLNEAQQQKQQPRQQQSGIQSRPQDSEVEWDNPKFNQKAVNSIERTKTKKIQAALKTLGYYKSSVDGLPGPSTTAAIKAWQKQVGEEPDGVVTSDQMEMLSLAATVKQESAPNAVPAVAPDDFQALQARAEQGDAKAQNELGRLYANGGRNVTRDDAQAAAWYRKAAEQGNADAQLQLAISYDLGQGVPKDVTEAAKWYLTGC